MEYRLAEFGRVFSTRDKGAATLADFRRKLGETHVESATIDFDDVLSVSYSFVDEFIGELVEVAGIAPRLVNVSPATMSTIERSLRTRGLSPDALMSIA
jgi:hypothetical protein